MSSTERLHFTFHFHAWEKEMATHSSVLAWRIPGTGEPGGLPSMRSHRVGHNWSDLAAVAAEGKWRDGRRVRKREGELVRASELVDWSMLVSSFSSCPSRLGCTSSFGYFFHFTLVWLGFCFLPTKNSWPLNPSMWEASSKPLLTWLHFSYICSFVHLLNKYLSSWALA